MNEQWKQQMQQKMADYRQPAPEVSWDELDKALASNRQKATGRRVSGNEAKVVPMWTRRIAAAVVALVAVTAGYLALNHEEAPINNKVEAAISHPEKPIVPSDTDEPQQPQQLKEEPGRTSTPTPRLLALNMTQETQEPQESQDQEVQNPEANDVQQPSETQETSKAQKVQASPKRQTQDEPVEIRKQTASENRLMAKVYLSNGISGNMFNNLISQSQDRGEFYTNDPKDRPFARSNNSISTWNAFVAEEYMLANQPDNPLNTNELQYMNYEEDVHHHLPVRFGLSLRYRLNDKWSLESGLTYTRLSSDYKLRIGDMAIDTEQTLQYLGIPVTASYQLWTNRYFSFYVSAGGMVEKMVKGSLHQESKTSRQENTESLSMRQLQFSVNGSLGAAFNLNRQFSLYAEPGMGYYFDNGSTIPTYYQDKPFSFNLNVGLRFNIK